MNILRDLDAILSQNRTRRRKDDFEPYTEPFRPLNYDEVKSIIRSESDFYVADSAGSEFLVSYQAIPGGFTICNILVRGRLYSGCSHCIKSDRWLAIRGKMNAFRRALEQSEGVELSQEKYFESDGLIYSSDPTEGEKE